MCLARKKGQIINKIIKISANTSKNYNIKINYFRNKIVKVI